MIIFSYVASALISLAYLLLATGLLRNHSRYFFSMLLVGNSLFAIYSFSSASYPALLLNLGFCLFAVLAITGQTLKGAWLSSQLFAISLFLTITISAYINRGPLIVIETLGWASMVGGFGSYLLYSQERISVLAYFLINMAVNICFSIYLYHYANYPYMALQMLVFCISGIGVLRLLFEQRSLETNC